MRTVAFAVLLLLSGCASTTGIIPDGKDAFRVMHSGDTGFTNSVTLQNEAYQEASDFCRKDGKVVETISVDTKQARPMGGWPSSTLFFRCVDRI